MEQMIALNRERLYGPKEAQNPVITEIEAIRNGVSTPDRVTAFLENVSRAAKDLDTSFFRAMLSAVGVLEAKESGHDRPTLEAAYYIDWIHRDMLREGKTPTRKEVQDRTSEFLKEQGINREPNWTVAFESALGWYIPNAKRGPKKN